MTRRPVVILLSITLLALLLRMAMLALVLPPQLTGDELYYVDVALHIAQGEGHYSEMYRSTANFPPAQAFVLSSVIAPGPAEDYRHLAPHNLGRLLLLEALLSTLLVALVGVLGRVLFDWKTAATAALCAAVYPTFIAFGHYLWSETLFLVFEVAGLIAAVRVARSADSANSTRWGWVLAAGLGFGAAALTREAGGLMAGAVALWWLWTGLPAGSRPPSPGERRRAAACGALLLTCTVLVVAPWSLRNARQFDRFVPVSTIGWMGMREGNTLSPGNWLRPDMKALRAFRHRYFGQGDEIARMELARREALALIRHEQPAWIFKKGVRNSAHFFAPDSFLFKKISRGLYGELPPWRIRGLLVLTMGLYLAVMSAALLGAALARGRGQRALPLLIAASVFAIHLVANASSRHRLSLMPLAMIYAAYALQERQRIAELPTATRMMVAAIAAIVLLWPLVYFAPDALSLWRHGTYLDAHRY